MKIRLVGVVLFHADGRMEVQKDGDTVMTKLLVAFPNLTNEPKSFFFFVQRV